MTVLTRRRSDLGLTALDCAKLTGLSFSYYVRLEERAAIADRQTRRKVCQVLDLTQEQVFDQFGYVHPSYATDRDTSARPARQVLRQRESRQ